MKNKKFTLVSQIRLDIDSVKISFDKNGKIFSRKRFDLKFVFRASNWLATFTNSKQKTVKYSVDELKGDSSLALPWAGIELKQNVFQLNFVGELFFEASERHSSDRVPEYRKMVINYHWS